MTSLMSQKDSDNELGSPSQSTQAQNSSPAGSSTQTSPPEAADIADKETAKVGHGMLKIDKDHSVYVGASHWSDVLHEVKISRSLL